MALIVAIVLASQSVLATAEPALCQSLTDATTAEEARVVRVETRGLSFLIPLGLAQEILESPDSEEISWKGGQLEIGYGSGTLRSIRAEELDCDIESGDGVGRVSLTESSGSLVAMFPDAYDRVRYHFVQVRSPSTTLQFRVLRTLLESTRFVNRIDNLLIDDIAIDYRSFRYRNEISDARTGRLGDIITRDYGRVESINKCGVQVVELVPDGAGGYVEKHKTIRVANCDLKP